MSVELEISTDFAPGVILAGASDAVLDGLARALLMDDAEREHLYRLARRADGVGARRRGTRTVPPSFLTNSAYSSWVSMKTMGRSCFRSSSASTPIA